MPFAHGEVLRHGGVPTIHVNGEPILGITATSVAFNEGAVISSFVDAGVDLLMPWIEIGIHCWKDIGVYDWTYAEEKLALFAAHGGDTHWVVRIRLGLAADWFAARFPGEVHQVIPRSPEKVGDCGLSVCVIHSSIWLHEVTRLTTDFITWLKTTRWAPRIAGFMLNAGRTEEWLPFDVEELHAGRYHPVYQREFRAWLQRHYAGNEAKLQASWSGHEATHTPWLAPVDSAVTFATASCPTGHIRKGSHIWGPYSLRDPSEDQAAIDYYRFMNETLADALISLCRTTKEAAGSPVLAGGFHSYLWWESGVYSYVQEYGHALVQRVKSSPWVDFAADITSYDCRYPGGPSGYLGLVQSPQLSGKLHYTECDLVSHASLPEEWRQAWKKADTSNIPARSAAGIIPERVWNWSLGYCGRDEAEQDAIFEREHWRNVISGTPWWWFDIRGHNYDAPRTVAKLAQLATQARELFKHGDRTSGADIAFICSEESTMHQSSMNGDMLRFELEQYHELLLDVATRKWGMCGQPYDTYELGDLAHPDFPGDRYKLLIFVNCAVVSPAEAAGVRRWQGNNRTLCWTHAAAAYHGGRIAPAANEELVGMRLGWRNKRQQIHITIEDEKSPWSQCGAGESFGTEGAVGPVFFADDPQARVLGRIRDGGEAGFAVREHATWNSVYLSMLNFGPTLLRTLARASGAHIWCETEDAVYASRSLVCIHTASAGIKRIRLPRSAVVTDLTTGVTTTEPVTELVVEMAQRRTRAWSLQ